MKKNVVTINVGQNEVWEVERVYPLERDSYWWTKPQLKQIRDDYKNEVMMEGVKKLVKARVEQEEGDKWVVEQRVEKIMQLDPGSIANFLQSMPNQVEKLPTTFNTNVSSNGSNLNSNTESDTDSGSDIDTDSDTGSDSDSESSSSASSSSSSDNEDERDNAGLVETRIGFKFTRKPAALSLNNWNDASKPLHTSDNDSSLSSGNFLSFSRDSLTPSKSYEGESNTQIMKAETYDDDLPRISVDKGTVHETMNSSLPNPNTSAETSSKTIKPNNQLDRRKQTEIDCIPKVEKRKSGRKRFKQGVLALLAMDRLEKNVKRNSSPSSTLYNMLSASSRLIDIYLPSDDRNEDDVDSTGINENGFDCSSCEDISECPICLNLVDPEQQRKMILLRRMLCKGCYFSYYINREHKYRNVDNDGTASRPICTKILSNCDESYSDVEILNSLKR